MLSGVVIAALLWLGLVILTAYARAIATRRDLATGLAILAIRIYVRVMHRPRVVHRERIPRGKRPGPLIVVANHTAGVDPLIIQALCEFEIRWMMAEDMRTVALDGFLRFGRVLFVDRDEPSPRVAMEAIRHLRAGGVLGIFPEGGISRPPGTLRPFRPGLGLLAARSGAPILCVLIEGTPDAPTAWGSFAQPSRPTITLLDVIESEPGRRLAPAEINERVTSLYTETTGWPVIDDEAPATQSA